MTPALLSIILDIVVLIFLGFTIYYAFRLSNSLNNFRAYRKEFDKLMQELNGHIEHAYEAVRALKDTSGRSGDDLEYLLREAQTMGKELKMLNETSIALARRLEESTEENGGRHAGAEPDNIKPFAILDPEFSNKEAAPGFLTEDDDDPETENLQSQAEKELYQALKHSKKSGQR